MADTLKTSSDKNPRPRGRPHKQSKDAALESHRARVRRAQKAYRTRKEAHVSAVEAKSRDLEKVVEEMTREFVGFSDALVEGGNVDERVVGPLLRGALERFLVLGRKAARGLEEGEGEGELESDGDDGGGSGASTVKGSETQTEKDGVSAEWQLATSLQHTANEKENPPFLDLTSEHLPQLSPLQEDYSYPDLLNFTTARNLPPFNPYLNNVWQSPSFPPSSSISPSILPHILAGRDSFASRLYFETISLAVQSLAGTTPVSFAFAQSMFRFKMRYASRTQLLGVLSGVLNTLLQGTSSFGGGAVFEMRDIKAAIVGEVERGGAREEEFLSTWEVERYLRTRWRLGIDSQAVRVWPASLGSADGVGVAGLFAPTMVPGFVGTEEVILNAEPLVERLKPAALSIGEGPRWHLGDIDDAVQTFLHENNVSSSRTSPFK